MTSLIKIAGMMKMLKDAFSEVGITLAEVRLATADDGIKLESMMNPHFKALVTAELQLPPNTALFADVPVTWPAALPTEADNAN